MSLLDTHDLHVSNNDGETADFISSINSLISLEIDPIKENRSPVQSITAAKKQKVEIDDDNGGDTDEEINNIRKEIERLSSRLDRLQSKRADQRDSTAMAKRGRVVSAKFMDPKLMPGSKNGEESRVDTRLGRRGMSLGPMEIIANQAKIPEPKKSSKKAESSDVPCSRGISLGPMEIIDTLVKVPQRSPVSKVRSSQSVSCAVRRRGVSLGPLEIYGQIELGQVEKLKGSLSRGAQTCKRGSPVLKKVGSSPSVSCAVKGQGVSLGPLEVHGQIELGQLEKPKGNPSRGAQSCKRASFKKLVGIEEENVSSSKSRPSLAFKGRVLLKPQDNEKTLSNVRSRLRGLSLGPSEIVRCDIGTHLRNKPQEIKQKGARIEKGSRSLSVSPKPQQPSAAKALELQKGIATVGAQKIGRREDMAKADFNPKVLSEEGVKAIAGKKPLKSIKCRVVPSRYSLAPSRVSGDEPGRKEQKWSLPEIAREKKKEVMMGSSDSMPDCEMDEEFEHQNQTIEDQGIPENLDEGSNSLAAAHSPLPITEVAHTLPRIKILRCNVESPRDSGCVKRASQLVGRRTPFAVEGGEEFSFHESDS